MNLFKRTISHPTNYKLFPKMKRNRASVAPNPNRDQTHAGVYISTNGGSGLTSVSNSTSSNCCCISGRSPLDNATIAPPAMARLYNNGLFSRRLSMKGWPCTEKEHIHVWVPGLLLTGLCKHSNCSTLFLTCSLFSFLYTGQHFNSIPCNSQQKLRSAFPLRLCRWQCL